ncbi:MAG: hypothetical protein UT43_C0015G0003 [Parcubacteria group bacterium GW2011_GWC1_39_29]|uniref:Glutamyl-tRNA amidotransferase n=1 Tax=Candidatus Yanofskybacteria bacterium GW2011_GWD1_39_16 TaxID=1619030 RepID=A0A837HSS5_9BACT|nr:MAG: hypothetical protein UT35_C0022G0003 [Candidatus Yanofskybacteria bacterium GW2011_GWD1_39_16]KKR14822.1 MAG: hypothetical protein UT43_C0015G0003 [Parcubacteria group bacterium GW2011_GWC1_39_29]
MLKEQIQNDIKEAMKSGNSAKRMALGMVMSTIKNKELEKRSKLSKTETDVTKLDEISRLSDEEIIDVVSSEIKKRKDSITSYQSGGRPELAEKENEEIGFISIYMPEQLGEDAVREEIKKTITEVSASSIKDMGKVIGAVMAKIKGKADGQLVSQIVKELLA